MKIYQKEKGFTIIEVVLVLAIAALIFLMVFIALPALERSQRDTARKNDVGIVSSGVESYISNNQGNFPKTADLGSYVTNISSNTTAADVTVNTSSGPTSSPVAPVLGGIEVTQATQCGSSTAGTASGDGETLTTGTTNQYTVVTQLESGGNAYYCIND
jgi:prepilin-type N-terminal cleavage/methylation domain-containing protein